MFRDEYRKLNDDIHASEALIHRTAEACGRKKEQPRSIVPVLAMMVCVLALLVLPRVLRPQGAGVAGENPVQTPQPVFTPIGPMTEFDGMTLRYLNSFATPGSRYILLSLQGDGISEEMSMKFALTSEKTGQTFWVGARQLHHDAGRKQSTFMVAFHENELAEYSPIELRDGGWGFPAEAYDPKTFRMLPEDDRLTLTVLEYSHILYESLEDGLALADLPRDVDTVWRQASAVYSLPPEDPDHFAAFVNPKAVEKEALAGCASMELFGSVRVTAGFDGSQLRVQTRHPQPLSVTDLSAYLYLVPENMPDRPWQTFGIQEGVCQTNLLFDWEDSETGEYFREYSFGVAPDEAAGLKLCAIGFRRCDLPDNTCTLTFTLGE